MYKEGSIEEDIYLEVKISTRGITKASVFPDPVTCPHKGSLLTSAAQRINIAYTLTHSLHSHVFVAKKRLDGGNLRHKNSYASVLGQCNSERPITCTGVGVLNPRDTSSFKTLLEREGLRSTQPFLPFSLFIRCPCPRVHCACAAIFSTNVPGFER